MVFRVQLAAIVLVIQMSQEFNATANEPVRDCRSVFLFGLRLFVSQRFTYTQLHKNEAERQARLPLQALVSCQTRLNNLLLLN